MRLFAILVIILFFFSLIPVSKGEVESFGYRAPFLSNNYSDLSYAIIAPSSFVNVLKPLSEWKTKKGVKAEIFTIEEIYSTMSGRDNPERIHNFLSSLYKNSTLKFVLLVGDADENNVILPTRYLMTNASLVDSDVSDYSPSDHYYAGLGSWDNDGDGKYGEQGEGDWGADVYVGRLPADNSADAQVMVNKILTYEKSPPIGNWMKSGMFIGSLMDIPNNIGNESTMYQRGYYEWWQDNGREAIENILPLVPSQMTKTVLYDYNQVYGGSYNSANDVLNKAGIISEYNNGYSVVTSASHGWSDGDGATNYKGNGSEPPTTPAWQNFDEFFYWDNARDASNGYKLPLWYVSGCDVGNFTEGWSTTHSAYDTNFEQLIKNPNGGAIGLIAPAGTSYRGEDDKNNSFGNWWMIVKFWEILFQTYTPGEALFKMKSAYYQYLTSKGKNPQYGLYRQNMATYNLLGDPEIPIWTDIPGNLNLSYPDKIYTTSQSITIRAMSGGVGIKNVRIALTNNDIYSVGYTDANGYYTLTLSPRLTGKLNITATIHNYLPYEGNITLLPTPPDLTVLRMNVSKDLVGVGEEVNISATIKNIGNLTAYDVIVEFFDGAPENGALIDRKTINQISDGEEVIVVSKFISNTTGIHKIYTVIDRNNAINEYMENNNELNYTITVTGMDIVPIDYKFNTGTTLKNGTHAVGNGTYVVLNVTIANFGDTGVSIYVRFEENGITISDDFLLTISPVSNGYAVIEWLPSPGYHIIEVIADVYNRLDEANESNNIILIPLMVTEPPTILQIPDIVINEDEYGKIKLRDYIRDPDTNIDILSINVSSSLLNLTWRYDFLYIYPEKDWYGKEKVWMEVNDSISQVRGAFNVTVIPVNDAPVIEGNDTFLGEFNVTVGYGFKLSINSTDVDSVNVTFTFEPNIFKVREMGNKSVDISLTPALKDVGRIKVYVTAYDGNMEDEKYFILNIIKPNTKPRFQLENNLTFYVAVKELFKYKFNATDTENDTLTYSIVFLEGNEIFTINSSNGMLRLIPLPEHVGKYRVKVIVSDGYLNDTYDFTLYVQKEKGERVLLHTSSLQIIGIILFVVIGVCIAMVFIIKHFRRGKKVYIPEEDSRYKQPRRQYEIKTEEPAKINGAWGVLCPKCGSQKVQMFGKEGICNICGKIFKV